MADVLIVEDDEEIAALIEMVVEDAGHTARVARHGEQGLEFLYDRLPDAVVMDVEMPILDGPGLSYRMLVENAGKEKIPIVMVSAVCDLRAVARRVGTPYFLAKPFLPDDLIALLARALRERRAPRPAPSG